MNPTTTLGGIKKAAEFPFKFLANGGHAQQAIPSQHRLFNAAFMMGGWWALDQLRDIVFGVNQVSEGEFVEIKKENVPAPLRFLHKAIDWDPYSDAPQEKWKKLAHQMMPAIGAGVGAVAGSMFAFELNGRARVFKGYKQAQSLDLLKADDAVQYGQASPLRVLTALFGSFSSASALTTVYGGTLNPSFASAAGARTFFGNPKIFFSKDFFKRMFDNLSHGNANPLKAANTIVGDLVHSKGKMSESAAQGFVDKVLAPMFGHELHTPELQERARKTLQELVAKSHEAALASGKSEAEIAAEFSKQINYHLKDGLGHTVQEHFGFDVNKATLGNANPIIRWPTRALDKAIEALGIKPHSSKVQEKLATHMAAGPSMRL